MSKLDYMYLEKTRLAGDDPACTALVLARAIQSARDALITAAGGVEHPENSDSANVTNSTSAVGAVSVAGSQTSYSQNTNFLQSADYAVLRRTAHLHADARYADDVAAFFARHFNNSGESGRN